MIVKDVVTFLGYVLEFTGVAIIFLGAGTAIARHGYRRIIARGGSPYLNFRETMGRAMLVGLDFLVARQDAAIARLTARVEMLMLREAEREADAGGTVPLADKPPPHW